MLAAKTRHRGLPKFSAPRRRPETTRRRRLNRRLSAALDREAIIVCAPAGYGKSTLVVDWLDDTRLPHAWLALDRQDRDPRVLLCDLAGTVNAAFPGSMEQFLRQLETATAVFDPVAFAGSLAVAVEAGVDDVFALILDDVHLLADSPAVEVLETLLDRGPMNVRLLVITRSWDALPSLSRQIGARRATALLEQDLIFDQRESIRLLRRAGVRLREDRREIAERAAGWATALAILSEHEDLQLPQGLSWKSDFVLSEFLDQEVLSRLSDDDRCLLEVCAILGTFSSALVDNIIRPKNSSMSLQRLHARTHLISKVGTDNYRMHKLLECHLLDRLRDQHRSRLMALSSRAHDSFIERGDICRAIETALDVEDWETAADDICVASDDLYQSGQFTNLASWIDLLPPPMLRKHHSLILLRARLSLKLLNASDGLARLKSLQGIALDEEEMYRVDLYTAVALRQLGRVAASLNTFGQIREAARQRQVPPLLMAELDLEEAVALGTAGCSELASERAAAAGRAFTSEGDQHRAAEAFECLAVTQASLGRAEEALRSFALARRLWVRLGDARRQMSTEMNIANLWRLQGDFEGAREAFHRIVEQASALGFRRVEAYSIHNLAAIDHDMGNVHAARELNEKASAIAGDIEDAVLHLAVDLERASILHDNAEVHAAAARYRSGLVQFEEIGWIHAVVQYRSGLGGVLLECGGSLAEARALLERALVEAASVDDARIEGVVRFRLAAALLAAQEPTAAKEVLSPLSGLIAQSFSVGFLLCDARRQSAVVTFARDIPSCCSWAPELEQLVFSSSPSSSGNRDQRSAQQPTIEAHALGRTFVTYRNRKVEDSKWRSDRAKEMLFLLLWHARPMRKEEIAVALWPDIAPQRVNNSFHSTLFRLRRALGRSVVSRNAAGEYEIADLDAITLDARLFADRVNDALQRGDRGALRFAADLYGGRFLVGCQSDWAAEVRAALEGRFVMAALELAELACEAGDPEESIEWARRVLELDPINEVAVCIELRCFAQLGRFAAIDSVYRTYAQLLLTEVGSTPSGTLKQLHRVAIAKLALGDKGVVDPLP